MYLSFSVRLAVLLFILSAKSNGRRHDADTIEADTIEADTIEADTIEAVKKIVERSNDDSEEGSCNRTVRKIINDYVLPVSWKVDDYRIVTVELCTDPNCQYPVNDFCIVCSARLEKFSNYWRITSEQDFECNSYDEVDISPIPDTIARNLFDEFVRIYDRTYADRSETEKRFGSFKKHLERVERVRKLETGSAVHGITFFADMTDEEFARLSSGCIVPPLSDKITTSNVTVDSVNASESFDWRDKGAVTSVKDQGTCGSCWAFSAMAVLETQYYKIHKKLVSFSPQLLVDCDDMDQGCNGGHPLLAFEYLRMLGGIETEEDYPYKGKSDTCRYDRSKSIAAVSKYDDIWEYDETKLAKYVREEGPIGAVINIELMKTYKKGVSRPAPGSCDPRRLSHGVVIVGFAVEEKTELPYWIIKNSWSESWGENGYYYLHKGSGACGVNTHPFIGYIKNDTTI